VQSNLVWQQDADDTTPRLKLHKATLLLLLLLLLVRLLLLMGVSSQAGDRSAVRPRHTVFTHHQLLPKARKLVTKQTQPMH